VLRCTVFIDGFFLGGVLQAISKFTY